MFYSLFLCGIFIVSAHEHSLVPKDVCQTLGGGRKASFTLLYETESLQIMVKIYVPILKLVESYTF